MRTSEETVETVGALVAASRDGSVRRITVNGNLANAPSIRLSPGQTLCGAGPDAVIGFAAGADGLQLSSDNCVRDIRLDASPDKRAIFNDTSVASLGDIQLRSVTTTGCVQILAREKVRGGRVDVDGLDIVAADARAAPDRPSGFGVDVLQGAFTLWNMQSDPTVAIQADLVGLSAGRDGAPVRGGGIFVSGGGDKAGPLKVRRLITDAIYNDGGIAPGTANRITGGVFTVYGTEVDEVINRGPIVTYGQNDMVLDNWGFVDRWTAREKITSHGPSGIGFVNFGTVNELKIQAPIETFGEGARGFNVYAGTVKLAEFDSVTTHAGGAIGIQITQPIGRLVVRHGIQTYGGTGQSLVKGHFMPLTAIALSIKPGGSARAIEIDGGVKTNAPNVAPIEQEGAIESLRITGGFDALGGVS
jgi:hypothetical protein